ncbi:MAG TPA: hypothetical protein VFW97_06500 [Acidimicrobiia bacterium]|nr:hypothetical protein [Acidimicrobiia bacterium]
MTTAALQQRRSTPTIVIVVVFVVSRVVAFAAGVRYDDGLLHNAYQLLDVRLLREQPFASIFYLHSQPPVFNVFTAAVVQLPDSSVQSVLAGLWALAGLATALLVFATMARLGVRPWLGAVIVCLFVVAPETILTESWFFYSQLQILLTALALFALARFVADRRTWDGVLFVSCFAALVLLRSSFHILLMVLVLVVVWRQLSLSSRQLAAIAALPLLVVVGWSVKNVLVFDSWNNSSWLGMNVSYVAHAGVSQSECRQLVADRTVSASACQVAFRKPSAYTRRFPRPTRYGSAATDALYKSTGQPNFNASLYDEVASQYQHDSIELLRHGGVDAVARAELAAYTVWAEPGDDSLQLRADRRPIAGYADWFDRLVLLRPVATGWNDPARFEASMGPFPWGTALGSMSYTILALVGFAAFGVLAGWRRGRRGTVLRTVVTVAAIVLAWSLVVGNALDYRENNRFRVEAGPLLLVLAAVGIEFTIRAVTTRRRAAGAPTTAPPVPAASLQPR